MRLRRADLIPYRLPLVEPVLLAATALTCRDGVLLRLEDETGAIGWGDAAPLPGFSREALPEVQRTLKDVTAALIGRALDPLDLTSATGSFHTALDAAALSPSARFALDLALFDVAAQRLGRSLPQAMHPDPAVILPVNGLLMGALGHVRAEAERLAAAGYRTLKLKVGRAPLADEIRLVRGISEVVSDGIALRLDANRAWTKAEAHRFAEAVADLPLDYVEEPLREAAGLPALWLDTRLPLAVDETLQEQGAEAIRGWAVAAVLKPTLVGGVAATLRLAATARARGVRPVLSAAFESGIGMRGVAALAAATGAEPAGLDPYRRFASDVLAVPLPLDRPLVDVTALFTSPLEVV
jgi:O-succinylbenzoate synthase